MSIHSLRCEFPAILTARTTRIAISFRPALLACVAVAMGGLASSAHASVTNGSFELPVIPAGTFSTFSTGSTAISGWTVVGPNSSVIGSSFISGGITYTAQDGEQWLDLTGPGTNSPSNGVTQNVVTTAGQLYRISFYVGSVTNNFNIFASTVDLSIDGGSRISFTNPTTPSTNLDWRLFSFDFVASSGMTNITFLNGSASGNQLSGLDNVAIEVVPAPSAAALLGLGGLMVSRRRRAAV